MPVLALGGIPVTRWGAGDRSMSWRSQGGCYEAEWTLLLSPRERPPVIARNTRSDMLVGGVPVWTGQVSSFDPDAGKITMEGPWRELDAMALTPGGTPSTTLDEAVDAAITRGALTVARPVSLSTTPVSTVETANLNSIKDLLDEWAIRNAATWWITPDRRIRVGTPRTDVIWRLLPDVGEIPWNGTDEATRMIGRYLDPAGLPRTAMRGSGYSEQGWDLSARGRIDATTAETILDQLLAAAHNAGFEGGIEIDPRDVLGEPHPAVVGSSVAMGGAQMLLPQPDQRPGRPWSTHTLTEIGEATWDVDGDTLTLVPKNASAVALDDVAEQLGAA